MASERTPGRDSEKPAGTPAEVFTRLLDAAVEQIAPENVAALDVPSDEIHQEILLPLLPAMLADKAIRNHWKEQKGASFFARLQTHLSANGDQPRWTADDFEIHVTASYSAGPDARALADTLLSEASLRDLTAELLNRAMEPLWADIAAAAPAPLEPSVAEPVPAEPRAGEELPVELEDELAASAPAAVPAQTRKLAGTVLREGPFRPQPWHTRHNPISAALHAPASGFKNYLARNPLERRSEAGRVWRAVGLS